MISPPTIHNIPILVSKRIIFFLLNGIPWLLFFWIPVEHAKMSVLFMFALTGWGMGILPQPIVSLSIMVLIPLLGLGGFADSLIGFSQPFVWLLVSTFILSAALENTGVGKRIALSLLRRAKGKTSITVLFVLIAVVVIGFLIPTAAGRSAMLMPVCMGIIHVVRSESFSGQLAKRIMLGVAFTSSLISWGMITGSSSSVYAVSALESMINFKWTYLLWLLCNFPIMALLILLLWLILGRKYPIKQETLTGGYEFIRKEHDSLGPIRRQEWNVLWVALFTLTGWVTEPFHGLSVSLIALIAAIISCIPVVGIQQWKSAANHISWDVIILFGAGYALAEALQRNETANWVAIHIARAIPNISPFVAALLMMTLILFLRLGYANMLAITASFLPITISLARIWDINPVWLCQIVIIACSIGYFLPVQSPSNLITFSYGQYTERDLAETGVLFSILVIVLVLLAAFFYWPLLGIHP